MQAVLPQTYPSIPFKSLTNACVKHVEQCRHVIGTISKSVYCESTDGGSSVGAHMRHIIERFHCFLDGHATGHVNYDQRKRDAALELDPDNADIALQAIIAALSSIQESDNFNLSISESVDEHALMAKADSTVERELMGLVSHTIHHLAIIAMLVKTQGCQVDEDLGKAPSTIIYEHQRNKTSE